MAKNKVSFFHPFQIQSLLMGQLFSLMLAMFFFYMGFMKLIEDYPNTIPALSLGLGLFQMLAAIFMVAVTLGGAATIVGILWSRWRRLRAWMGDSPADAWSPAMSGSQTGGLWVTEEAVHYADAGTKRQWRLDEIEDIRAHRELGFIAGIRWKHRDEEVVMKVNDAAGWMDVLLEGSARPQVHSARQVTG